MLVAGCSCVGLAAAVAALRPMPGMPGGLPLAELVALPYAATENMRRLLATWDEALVMGEASLEARAARYRAGVYGLAGWVVVVASLLAWVLA